jgi:hypothetical protein
MTLLALVLGLTLSAAAQAEFPAKRTITKTDRFDFGAGGTVVITGAPTGSIEIIGSQANEIEITAHIELQAASEADLNTLATMTGFATDESASRTGIITIGNHNKFGLKKLPKNFSKHLLAVPFTVSYVVRVPRYSDLEIDGGKGDLLITGVEGSIRANFLESTAKVEIIGGATTIILGKGSADVSFGVKGWRGRSANIQVASGDLTVRLPSSLSADIDAVVLRTGSIDNGFPDLKPRDRKIVFTDKSILARAGVGGVPLKFAVGDGNLRIELLKVPL